MTRMVWQVVRNRPKERFRKQRRYLQRRGGEHHPRFILLHVFVYGLRRFKLFGIGSGPGRWARQFPWNRRRRPWLAR